MSEAQFWPIVFREWDRYVLLDLEQYFHVDVYDLDEVARPWRWLRNQILGLIDIPDSRLARNIDRS
ncbi:hypothetical protein [uncultured Microbacterium sp.]|uniref:hypothetical protein n=1 Tax=uncultured Microbacterium sp. TaxID=191216 RepID=UPI0025E4ED1E|nr:hypothetical protein [uncultured Microbacterium sp.]